MMVSVAIPASLEDDTLSHVLTQLAEELQGKGYQESPGNFVMVLPIRHPFWQGTITLLIQRKGKGNLSLQQKGEDLTLSSKGKRFLMTGVVATIPWILWPFFPSLLPLAGFCGIILFMVWLGVARKPHHSPLKVVAHQVEERLSR